ncbi:hypothetical protein FA13DRAFT_1169200 [Coprinellus micaceus]|uniref:Uncharacterized protein n=1 Tax=Coprinellus micaceus TaxID=71717 RepID=A0A4Y7SU95_COPMI|nr:hypothetical protein FA13DRAFT_1169200 [Coprinellus micaceus]
MARSYKPLKRSRSLDLSGQGHLYSTLCLPTKLLNPVEDLEPSKTSDDEALYSSSLSPQTAVDCTEGSAIDCDFRPGTPPSTAVDEATPPTAVEALVQDKTLAEDTEDDTTCYCVPSDDEGPSAIGDVGRVVAGVGQAHETADTDDEGFSWAELEGNSLGLYIPGDPDSDDCGTQPSNQEPLSQGVASSTSTPELSPLDTFDDSEHLTDDGGTQSSDQESLTPVLPLLVGLHHLEDLTDLPVHGVDQRTWSDEEDDGWLADCEDNSDSSSPRSTSLSSDVPSLEEAAHELGGASL